MKESSWADPTFARSAALPAVAELVLHAPGIPDEARLHAQGVALEVLRRAGVTVEAARQAVAKRDAWGDSEMAPMLEPNQDELHAAAAWDDATQAALMACYRGRNIPLDAELYVA